MLTIGQKAVDELAAKLEAARPDIIGKLTADVPNLADFRLDFRRRFYGLATIQFVAAVLNALLAANETGFFHYLNTAAFCLSFCGMFSAEFKARRLTRQLNRPAAEQVARDALGLRG